MSDRPPARKRFGQHFLSDGSAVERIVGALDPRPDEAVLEIGPGRGVLTHELIRRAGRIAAIELDRDLCRMLRAVLGPERLLLVEEDVLDVDLATIAARLGRAQPAPLVVVGNLPYNISKPVASKLVREHAVVDRAVLMFQREVAERLVAREGQPAYGPLSVLVGEVFRVERLFDLAPRAFRPSPRVTSSVTSWHRRGPAMSADEERRLRVVLGACFASRRKTLRNNLRAALGDDRRALELLERAELDGAARAETVGAEGFRRLARLWPSRG